MYWLFRYFNKLKTLLLIFILLCITISSAICYWLYQPILPSGAQPIEFSIAPGTSSSVASQQIVAAGAPLHPSLFSILVRASSQSTRLKAGTYELKPGTTPLQLLDQMIHGEFAQAAITIPEGWTFKQMRAAIDQHPALKHDTQALSDRDLLRQITTQYTMPEGLFFPDTYLFAKGSSDWLIYKRAFVVMEQGLQEAWNQRDLSLPYKTPYEALIIASVIEKETSQTLERPIIAGVFIKRLETGMALQADPTVIYGMGDQYHGVIYKSNLLADTVYNTYTRKGLPPTPIALPGTASLTAALHPAKTNALYFVARGDGTSQFSEDLRAHHRAVGRYQQR